MVERIALDFTKPLNPVNAKWKSLQYMGPQNLRDGKPITDEFVHLVIMGFRNSPFYINDYGEGVGEGGETTQLVCQPVPKAKLEGVPRGDGESSGHLTEALQKLQQSVDHVSDNYLEEYVTVQETKEQVDRIMKVVQDHAAKTIAPLAELRSEVKANRDKAESRYQTMEKKIEQLFADVKTVSSNQVKLAEGLQKLLTAQVETAECLRLVRVSMESMDANMKLLYQTSASRPAAQHDLATLQNAPRTEQKRH